MSKFKKEEIGTINGVSKVFLHDLLELTCSEISVNSMSAGEKLPFNHRHKQNEEVYIFIKGEGAMTIDNEVIKVKEGSCIKVLAEANRTMEAKTDLQYICIQAKSNSLEQFGLADAELC